MQAEDFTPLVKFNPESKTTEVIVEFPASGNIYTATINNREYPSETNALINGAIYKLVYQEYIEHMKNIVKEQLREKFEQKNIEIVNSVGRPKTIASKHNMTEEQKQYTRRKSLRHYYKKKQSIKVGA